MLHQPNKKHRAKLLSKNPEIFNGNVRPPMATNDISKSFGQGDRIKSAPLPKVKRG